jgi:hypothetical protein
MSQKRADHFNSAHRHTGLLKWLEQLVKWLEKERVLVSVLKFSARFLLMGAVILNCTPQS